MRLNKYQTTLNVKHMTKKDCSAYKNFKNSLFELGFVHKGKILL